MARINAVFDEAVDYGFEGGVRYKTDIADNPNRFEERDSEWRYGKHEFEASFGNIKDADRDKVLRVFHICRGRRHSFMFKDWNDFQILNQELIVGTVGTTESIQVYKKYEGFGQGFTIRPIQALKTAFLYDQDDNEVAGTWDMLTGVFTPDTEWGEGPYTVDCEFYVWVRFDADYNPMAINSWQANTTRVQLIEDPIAFMQLNVPVSWNGE